MCKVIEARRKIIYFDVTAGRGSYEDEYDDEEINTNIDSNQNTNEDTNTEKTNVVKSEEEVNKNEYKTTFKNFSEIQPKFLSQQNFNSIENQRRHSCGRAPRGRAPTNNNNYNYNNNNNYNYNNSKQASDYSSRDNNCYSRPRRTVLDTENNSPRKSELKASINWSPKRLSTN